MVAPNSELEKYILEFLGTGAEDLSGITSFFHPVTLGKGSMFLKTGRPCDRIGFIQSGLIREYVLIGEKEVTKWIGTPGNFVVDLSGFLFQKPSRWNIQALTDCELFVLNQNDYNQLGKIIPEWDHLEKQFLGKCFTLLEDRIITHLSMSAEERYHQLFLQHGELFNQVPLQYLASMLGMTPETLSRIRKKGLQ
jgi:CRP/FNR family transcriptional regulator, anaerobic regulatory protein